MYIIMYKYSALKINRKSFPNNIKNPIAPAQRKHSPPSPSTPSCALNTTVIFYIHRTRYSRLCGLCNK